MNTPLARLAVLASLIAVTAALPLRADEGMWTLDNPPTAMLQKEYGFTPTAEWLARAQKGCVNFGGASGSFVSASGLVLTNHHVALNQLQKMSTPEKNYVRDGFFARAAAEEIKCPDQEVKVLQSYENVTDKVMAAVDAQAPLATQNAQRRAAMAKLETDESKASGLKCEVVELYHGGEYWVYRYKKYDDVRLVMAPEEQIAFFGGDPDNFSYPRHDLDMAFFRVCENSQPVHPESWFKISPEGPQDGDLVFVVGHPGRTSRLKTVAQLEYERDIERPARIAIQEHRLAAIRAYEKLGPEQERRAKDRDRGLENNLKRERAFLELLREGPLLERKRKEETALRGRVAKDPKNAASAAAWDRIAAAQKELRGRAKEWIYRDLTRGPRLVNMAENIVRYVAEIQKPNEKRFHEFRDSNLASQRLQMFTRAPQFPDLDAVVLAQQLTDARAALGAGDPWVKAALGGSEPGEVAKRILDGTKLGDVAARKALVDGGPATIAASTDPLIVWVRTLDPIYRDLRDWHEERVETVESLEGGRIARAQFALDGKTRYPDATGTLRLSPGKVAGYEQLTTHVPWKTTWAGLYDRSASFDDREPFDLPARVAAARSRIDLMEPLNFVCTSDIIGGSSGSPALSRDLAVVGLVFDGNVQAFEWEFAYDERAGRTVAVDSAAILQGLRGIYGMGGLADELEEGAQAAK